MNLTTKLTYVLELTPEEMAIRGRRLVGELRPRDNPAAAALNLRMQEARAERARASAEGTAQAVERAKQYAKAHPSGEEPQ